MMGEKKVSFVLLRYHTAKNAEKYWPQKEKAWKSIIATGKRGQSLLYY
jgi:hypothetical protein